MDKIPTEYVSLTFCQTPDLIITREVIRVSGNIGLKISDSDFSRNVNGYKSGAISDDVLFVGFKDHKMYLIPLEVKTGSRPDYKKAVLQAKELKRYLTEDILGKDSLSGSLFRGLFIRQVLMQIDKYLLYKVYKDDYFKALLETKERGVPTFAKAHFGHPSPSSQQKLNGTD